MKFIEDEYRKNGAS